MIINLSNFCELRVWGGGRAHLKKSHLIKWHLLWTELCPLKIHVETLIPNETVFRDRTFRKVITLNEARRTSRQ